MRCDAPQLQLEQRAAFASHEALAAALDETHRTTIALHTYEASAECRTALFDALPLRWKAGDRVARIEWHNRSPADEQGALWRAALARELGASAPVEDAAPSARSAARFPYRFAIVLRCDLLLYDGEQLLRRLLRTWESDQRQPVFAFPSANWYRQRQPPTSEGDGVNSTSASHRFLLAGKPVDTPAPLDGPLLPTTRMFACREFAMLLTRSPSVSDQLHLIPASLFGAARGHRSRTHARTRATCTRMLPFTLHCRRHVRNFHARSACDIPFLRAQRNPMLERALARWPAAPASLPTRQAKEHGHIHLRQRAVQYHWSRAASAAVRRGQGTNAFAHTYTYTCITHAPTIRVWGAPSPCAVLMLTGLRLRRVREAVWRSRHA